MAAMPDAGGPHSSASPSSASPSSASPSSDANEEPAGLAGRDPNYEDSDGDDSDSDSGEDEDEDEDERSQMKDLGLLSSSDDDDDDEAEHDDDDGEAEHDKANDEAEHDKADVRRPRGRPKGASSVDYKGVRLARFGTQKEFKQWRNDQSFKLRHMGNNDKRSIWGCMDHHCEGGGPCAYELAAFKDGIGVELWHPVGGAVHSTTPVVLDSTQPTDGIDQKWIGFVGKMVRAGAAPDAIRTRIITQVGNRDDATIPELKQVQARAKLVRKKEGTTWVLRSVNDMKNMCRTVVVDTKVQWDARVAEVGTKGLIFFGHHEGTTPEASAQLCTPPRPSSPLSLLACHVAPSSSGAPPPRARRRRRSVGRSVARSLAHARTHARTRTLARARARARAP